MSTTRHALSTERFRPLVRARMHQEEKPPALPLIASTHFGRTSAGCEKASGELRPPRGTLAFLADIAWLITYADPTAMRFSPDHVPHPSRTPPQHLRSNR